MYAPRIKGQLKRVLNQISKPKYYTTKKYKKRIAGGAVAKGKQEAKLINNLKAEKKIYTFTGTSILGQVNANNFCCDILDFTPSLKNGTLSTDRIGNKVDVKSLYLRYMVLNTSIQSAPVRFKMYVVSVIGNPYDNTSIFISDFLKPNPYIQALNIGSNPIYDYFSPRNEKMFQRFKVLAQKDFRMSGDTVSGQHQQTEIKVGFKNKSIPLRWLTDSTTVASEPGDGQLLIVVVADRGNYGGTCTLSGVIDTAAGTGYATYFNASVYFTDI